MKFFQVHQYTTHSLGYLCSKCKCWLISEEVLDVHTKLCSAEHEVDQDDRPIVL